MRAEVPARQLDARKDELDAEYEAGEGECRRLEGGGRVLSEGDWVYQVGSGGRDDNAG